MELSHNMTFIFCLLKMLEIITTLCSVTCWQEKNWNFCNLKLIFPHNITLLIRICNIYSSYLFHFCKSKIWYLLFVVLVLEFFQCIHKTRHKKYSLEPLTLTYTQCLILSMCHELFI